MDGGMTVLRADKTDKNTSVCTVLLHNLCVCVCVCERERESGSNAWGE